MKKAHEIHGRWQSGVGIAGAGRLGKPPYPVSFQSFVVRLLTPSSGVTGSSPSPLILQDPLRPVFHTVSNMFL